MFWTRADVAPICFPALLPCHYLSKRKRVKFLPKPFIFSIYTINLKIDFRGGSEMRPLPAEIDFQKVY